MKRFAGKVALITGAARGIGRGIALKLASEGADIVIIDLKDSAFVAETSDAILQLGQQVLFCPADVSDRGAMEESFVQAVAHFGHIDIAVANAATSVRALTIDAKWEDARRTMEVCQFGVYHTCQLAAQQMVRQHANGRQGGKILIIGSVLGEYPFVQSAPYNMAKAAVNHFARTLAAELLAERINVNVINPGWIDTPGERAFASEEEIQAAAKNLPWGRLGQPDDIANAAAFLLSPEADYITGTRMLVDGGYLIGMRVPNETD